MNLRASLLRSSPSTLIAFSVSLLALLAGGSVRADVAYSLGNSFTGSTYRVDSPYVPPDCNGMAGPAHYVEFINGRFSVYDKTNGTRVFTESGATFWANAGVSLGAATSSDPRLVYDPSTGHWFATAIDLNRGSEWSNRFLLAVSVSADPTKTWKGYAFLADPEQGNFADFPTFGLDKDGVYLCGDMFDKNGNDLDGNTLVSIPKADLLAQSPSIDHRKSFGFLPGDSYGQIFQPVINLDFDSSDGKVLAVGSLGIDFKPHSNLVWTAIHNVGVPENTSLGNPVSVSVPQYSVPINPPQPGGDDSLDDGDARLSANVYQVGGVIYGTHAIDVADRAAVRWYRLSAANGGLLESGTITHPDLDLFYPSIAANKSGVMVIGCNGCSSNSYISCYAYVGQTVNGITTMKGPVLLKAGLATYDYLPSGSSSNYRWGDYSATCVDPIDPFQFWTIQMYPSTHDTWVTYIAEVRTALPQIKISATETPGQALLSWQGSDGVLELESASTADSSVWTPVDQKPSASQGKVQVLVPTTGAAAYFRLKDATGTGSP
jgi:hypothetical protein